MKKIIVFMLIAMLPYTKSFACTCMELKASLSKKVSMAYHSSDVIIIGKVIDVTQTNSGLSYPTAASIIYTFKITETLKGQLNTSTIKIRSASSSASCGYKFLLGQTYLVYAYAKNSKNERLYHTGLCERNAKLNNVKKRELKKLQRLKCKHQ